MSMPATVELSPAPLKCPRCGATMKVLGDGVYRCPDGHEWLDNSPQAHEAAPAPSLSHAGPEEIGWPAYLIQQQKRQQSSGIGSYCLPLGSISPGGSKSGRRKKAPKSRWNEAQRELLTEHDRTLRAKAHSKGAR